MTTIITNPINGSIKIDNGEAVILRAASNSLDYKVSGSVIIWLHYGKEYFRSDIADTSLNGEQLTSEDADEKLSEALFI